MTLIDADKSSQGMVESLGEEGEKVRVKERERGWRGDGEGMEGGGRRGGRGGKGKALLVKELVYGEAVMC